jgi:hypothetical protein
MRVIQATRNFSIRALTALALWLVLTGGTAKAQFLFDGFNIFVVFNKPTKPTLFYVGGNGWNVTAIANYHWNNGLGLPNGKTPNITLVDAKGKNYGPYAATGKENNAYIATVTVFLHPGWYTVMDSEPDTWSQNLASGGRGFTRVFGDYIGYHFKSGPGHAPPPSSVPAGFKPCGNVLAGSRVEMSPCTGTSSTVITMVVVNKPLSAPLTSVTFRLLLRRFGDLSAVVLPVTAPVNGSGLAVGSVYTVNSPTQLAKLCIAGQFSEWGMYPYDVNGMGYGEIGWFDINGCPI